MPPVSLGAFSMGAAIAWTSPTLPNLEDCSNNTLKPDGCAFEGVEYTSDQTSWIASLFNIGALISSCITGFVMSKLGRRYTIIVMAIPFIAGSILLALTKPLDLSEIAYFYVGRILAGEKTALCCCTMFKSETLVEA